MAKLFRNALRYRLQHIGGKPSLPQAISIEITRRCVARCLMCNIWKEPESQNDLSVQQWITFLEDPLFEHLSELDITGGEPFLRNDLPELIAGICELTKHRLPSLASIAITTNGLLGETVIEKATAMLETAQRCGIHLVIVCAVDATDSGHDRIRNHPGAWSKVNGTIEALCEVRTRYPNLILGLKTTVLPFNVDNLVAIRQYAQTKGMFTIISPCIITPGRYLNPDRAGDLAFDSTGVSKMIKFYREEPQEWGFHADAMVRLLTGRRRKKTCSAGYNYFFVRSNGELMLCPLIAHSMGNITRQPTVGLYHSPEADVFRRGITRFDQCENCTEPGLERYALAYEGFALLNYFWKFGQKRFWDEFQHLGLVKLIDN
jgi:MoaA/NifB/PqqE/SkfB family radical SAM enzyme